MLSFINMVSGGQVADQIAQDDEEFAEMLKGLVAYDVEPFAALTDFLDEDERAAVSGFLRGIADLLDR